MQYMLTVLSFMNFVQIVKASPFNDFFSGDPVVLNVYSIKQPPLPNNYFYDDCSFTNMLSRSVTHSSDVETQIMFENCLFFNCTTFNKRTGGAFYIDIPNGGCILRRSCASCCQTENSYQLGYIYTKTESPNSIYFFSFEKCSLDLSGYSIALYLCRGTQTINNMNSSKNTGNQQNGFYSSIPSPLMFSFCTVSNINNTNGFHVSTSSNIGFFRYSNFVNLLSQNTGSYCIYLSGGFIMEYCTIKSWQGYAIYGSTAVIVRYCCFDSTINQTFGSFSLSSPYGNTATYIIEHYSTAMCEAQNQIHPPQTPMPSATHFDYTQDHICQTLPPPPTPPQTIQHQYSINDSNALLLGSIIRVFTISMIQLIFN